MNESLAKLKNIAGAAKEKAAAQQKELDKSKQAFDKLFNKAEFSGQEMPKKEFEKVKKALIASAAAAKAVKKESEATIDAINKIQTGDATEDSKAEVEASVKALEKARAKAKAAAKDENKAKAQAAEVWTANMPPGFMRRILGEDTLLTA